MTTAAAAAEPTGSLSVLFEAQDITLLAAEADRRKRAEPVIASERRVGRLVTPRVKYLTAGQAADLLGVNRRTVARWCESGRIGPTGPPAATCAAATRSIPPRWTRC